MNPLTLTESEKNRIRNLHKTYSIIKEQELEVPLPELPDGCEECLKVAIGNKYSDKADTIILALNRFFSGGETPSLIEVSQMMTGINPLDAISIGPKLLACEEICSSGDVEPMELASEEIDEDTEGEETYHYGELEGEDEKRLRRRDLSRSHARDLRKDMAYDEEHEYRGERGTHFEGKRPKKIITEQLKKFSKLLSKAINTIIKKGQKDPTQLTKKEVALLEELLLITPMGPLAKIVKAILKTYKAAAKGDYKEALN